MPEVYLLTCRPTGRQYVGIAKTTAKQRFKSHCKMARKGSQLFLHRAISKYSPDAFDLRVLETVELWAEASALEQRYIVELGTRAPVGFNMTLGGEGTLGYRHTDESRAAMSRKHTGKVLSDETRRKMSVAKRDTQSGKGKRKSPETVLRMTAASRRRYQERPDIAAKMIAANQARKGWKHTEESKQKIGAFFKGKKQDPAVVAARIPFVKAGMTPEVRAKISASNSRRTLGAETRQKLSVSIKAATVDPEVKAKIAASNARRVWTPEARAKMRETVMAMWTPEARARKREAIRMAKENRSI